MPFSACCRCCTPQAASRSSAYQPPRTNGTTGAELIEPCPGRGFTPIKPFAQSRRAPSAQPCSQPPHKSGASMIVMGAYTHSRWRHSFLGGVTMHVLSEAVIPIVMSH